VAEVVRCALVDYVKPKAEVTPMANNRRGPASKAVVSDQQVRASGKATGRAIGGE
jgi:hypothetical protein